MKGLNGFEFTGEYRVPMYNELYYSEMGQMVAHATKYNVTPVRIVRRIKE